MTCFVLIQSVRVNFACTKRHFKLSAQAIINARNARLCGRCAKFLSKIKRIPFFSIGLKAYFFEESPKSIQDAILLEMCFVLESIVPKEGNASLSTII